ncbi:MAG: NAD kinase, partial [Ferrovibrio sp.]
MTQFSKVAFVAARGDTAEAARERLASRYGDCPPEKAEVIVALGGDGFMLQTLHQHMMSRIPIYGMNQGTVGFLMNEYREDDLIERLKDAQSASVHPLRMRATTVAGTNHEALAINEVALLRQTRQSAKLRISIDGTVRVPELVCDGAMVATPAGSTAYNLSAHGPVLPLSAGVLALTPISAFRPRRWRGALLGRSATVRIDVLENAKRPVSATADFDEVRDVMSVEIAEAPEISLKLLFDAGHGLEERI